LEVVFDDPRRELGIGEGGGAKEASQHTERRDVQVGPFATPLREDRVEVR